MAAMGGMAMGGMPQDPMAPPPMPPMGPQDPSMAPPVDPMTGMPMDPMMDPAAQGGVMPPQTATPLNGAGAAPGMAVDLGGMGAPPVMAPDSDDLIMSALQAVLGKWGAGNPMIAGEKNELLQTLMQLASAQPPMAPEAFIEGGIPTNFGMAPQELDNPMGTTGMTY